MRLLVSVRSPREVKPALSGGADIIDAKEPSRGSLGAVSPDVLASILSRIPPDREASIALGDMASPGDVVAAMSLTLGSRRASTYLKLGFAGVSSARRIERLLHAALAASREFPLPPRIIAVAYADADRARSASPAAVCRAAVGAEICGLLVDTYTKDGSSLLTWLPPDRLGVLLASARAAGLLTAVAGALTNHHLPAISQALPDVVGFRGAACGNGREGSVSLARVAQLRRHLDLIASGFVQGAVPKVLMPDGETHEARANLGRDQAAKLLKIND